jgi:hypothetical protein
MTLRHASAALGLMALGAVILTPAKAAEAPAPGISAEASAAIEQMSKTLSAKSFSFEADTIRVYQDEFGQPLHIFHEVKVIVRRPDHLAVHRTGDDGMSDLYYDGKTVTLYSAQKNEFARVDAPDKIESMLEDVSDRLNVDFPFADFVAADPGKSLLSGVTSGRELAPVTIEGKPAQHLFFSQTGGVDLEVWLGKSEQPTPERLIATYRLMPGQPSFIAEFSDWNLTAQPSDADFTFQPPAGAKQVDLSEATEKKEKK